MLSDLDGHQAIPQSETGVTYSKKIKKSEARIDFNNRAEDIGQQIDAFNPAPGAYFEYQGERVRILKADWNDGNGQPGEVLNDCLEIACGEDIISPVRVQRAGRNEMSVFEFLRGCLIPVGTILK